MSGCGTGYRIDRTVAFLYLTVFQFGRFETLRRTDQARNVY